MNFFQLLNAVPELAGRVTWDTAPTTFKTFYAVLSGGPSNDTLTFSGALAERETLSVTIFAPPDSNGNPAPMASRRRLERLPLHVFDPVTHHADGQRVGGCQRVSASGWLPDPTRPPGLFLTCRYQYQALT